MSDANNEVTHVGRWLLLGDVAVAAERVVAVMGAPPTDDGAEVVASRVFVDGLGTVDANVAPSVVVRVVDAALRWSAQEGEPGERLACWRALDPSLRRGLVDMLRFDGVDYLRGNGRKSAAAALEVLVAALEEELAT